MTARSRRSPRGRVAGQGDDPDEPVGGPERRGGAGTSDLRPSRCLSAILDPYVISGTEDFPVVDAIVRYRLSKRWGVASIEVRNIFDEEFLFPGRQFPDIGASRSIQQSLAAGLDFRFA